MSASRTPRVARSSASRGSNASASGRHRRTAHASTHPVIRTAAHYDAIDGLRAIAIIGVILYHTRPSLLHGGFLGVTLFFVVSGFFITRGIMRAHASGSFNYVRYLLKRCKRLWPAVLTTIALVAMLAWLFSPALLTKEQTDALPSALFYSNWSFIFRKLSYFQQSGLPSPLTHLWYTSLIMQFYVLWPWLVALICSRWTARRLQAIAVAVLAALSTVEMTIMSLCHVDTSRLYYGLDTRAGELLVGALLAILLTDSHSGRTDIPDHDARASGARLVDIVGWIALTIVVIGFVGVRDQSAWLYRGGLLAVAILGAVVVWAATGSGTFARVLACKPLRWLGSRSFSLYLVHYPLLEIMNPATRVHNPAWWQWVLQFIVILAAGELFYQLFEALRGTPWLPWAHTVHRRKRGALRPGAIVGAIVGVCVTVSMTVMPGTWTGISKARSIQLRPELAGAPSATTTPSGKAPQEQPSASASAEANQDRPEALVVPDNLDPSSYKCDKAAGVCHVKALIVGDSVTVAAQEAIQARFPDALVDAETSRHFWAMPGVYGEDIQKYQPQVICIMLNINGPVTEHLIEATHGHLGDTPTYLMTGRAPIDWVEESNQTIVQYAKDHPTFGVIDWSALSGEHPEYLIEDGTHPTEAGAQALADLMYKAFCG